VSEQPKASVFEGIAEQNIGASASARDTSTEGGRAKGIGSLPRVESQLGFTTPRSHIADQATTGGANSDGAKGLTQVFEPDQSPEHRIGGAELEDILWGGGTGVAVPNVTSLSHTLRSSSRALHRQASTRRAEEVFTKLLDEP
jgi:hypothetical protein